MVMAKKDYRNLEKVNLGVQVPPSLKHQAAIAAAVAGMKTSEWVALCLCRALEVPESRYGIKLPAQTTKQ